MNLEALIAKFRRDADDREVPPAFDDELVVDLLNEAEREAAVRGRLLHESANPAICQIPVVAGTAVYALHASLYELTHIAFRATGATRREPLVLKSEGELDRIEPEWRDQAGTPKWAIQDDTGVRLVPAPAEPGVLLLEGYRLPLADMSGDNDAPEIHRAHHERLVDWALFGAFSIPDADRFDPQRAGNAEKAFTAYFGPRPDSDLRRITREDVAHHNVAYFA